MGPRRWTRACPSRRAWSTPDPFGPGSAVVVLGLIAAASWGTADFGGGLLSRGSPLLGVVLVTQGVGLVLALAVGIARGEPVPDLRDTALSIGAGLTGVIGITSLYRGLAVGRMGVVAPTTGVLAALVPVVVGFGIDGVPGAPVLAGIVAALAAVVLVTRSGRAEAARPSGIEFALLAGGGIGLFNVFAGQLSDAGAFVPLTIIRAVQALVLGALIVTWRQPWRLSREGVAPVTVVGLLDMAGNAGFILAAQAGDLAIAAVLSSLYPVVTVVLAIALLAERMTRGHVAGIGLTVAAIVLIGSG
jgi:drug/metabolite transporter (DMT)-like permease